MLSQTSHDPHFDFAQESDQMVFFCLFLIRINKESSQDNLFYYKIA